MSFALPQGEEHVSFFLSIYFIFFSQLTRLGRRGEIRVCASRSHRATTTHATYPTIRNSVKRGDKKQSNSHTMFNCDLKRAHTKNVC